MCIWLGALPESFSSGLQDCPAAPSHLGFAVAESRQEPAHPILHHRSAPQAQVARGFPRFHEGRLSLAHPQMASSPLKSGL